MPLNDTIFKRLEKATKQERKDIYNALQLNFDDSDSVISEKYRSAAGHSVVNVFRGKHDLPYKQILIDVVDKLKPDRGWTDFRLNDQYSEEHIENKILEYLTIQFEKEMNKLSPKERKNKEKKLIKEMINKGYTQTQASIFATAFVSGSVGIGLASTVTLSIFYSGFFSSIGAAIFGINSAILVASGTGVGAAVALPLLLATLGDTAYRKTIPTTLEFIKIRMRIDSQQKENNNMENSPLSSSDTKSSATYEYGTEYHCNKCGRIKTVYFENGFLHCAYCHKEIPSPRNSKNEGDQMKASKAFEELKKFIGLISLKKEIEEEIKIVQYQREKDNENLYKQRRKGQSQHLIFLGNPGTGKTEVARVMGEIYKELGVLDKGHFNEYSRKDLVAAYEGQTALKTKKKIDDSLGGIMFIDEAYSLYTGYEDKYGLEAIDTIVKYMEDYRDKFILIVAGYQDEMINFLSSNPGLESRFRKKFVFPDYSDLELFEIGIKFFKDQALTLSEPAETAFKNIIKDKKKNYNARGIRMLVDSAIRCLDLRMASTSKAERLSKRNLILDIDFKVDDSKDEFNVSFLKIQLMIELIWSDESVHESERFFIEQLIKFSTLTEANKEILHLQINKRTMNDSEIFTIFDSIDDRDDFLLDLEKLAKIDGILNEKEMKFINKLQNRRG